MKAISDEVYFIAPVGGGRIKIGCSIQVKERLKAFQLNSPVELEILAVATGRWLDEQYIHWLCRATCWRGEWFDPSPELLALIDEVRTTGKLPKYAICRAQYAPLWRVRPYQKVTPARLKELRRRANKTERQNNNEMRTLLTKIAKLTSAENLSESQFCRLAGVSATGLKNLHDGLWDARSIKPLRAFFFRREKAERATLRRKRAAEAVEAKSGLSRYEIRADIYGAAE